MSIDGDMIPVRFSFELELIWYGALTLSTLRWSWGEIVSEHLGLHRRASQRASESDRACGLFNRFLPLPPRPPRPPAAAAHHRRYGNFPYAP